MRCARITAGARPCAAAGGARPCAAASASGPGWALLPPRLRVHACPAELVDPALGPLGLAVLVVPVPPDVRRTLRIALGRVLPLLLATERGDVEVAPGSAHRLVTATVDEVGAEHPVAVADEGVRAVPLVDPEVGVEAVGHRVPRHLPAHPLLHPRDVGLRRA